MVNNTERKLLFVVTCITLLQYSYTRYCRRHEIEKNKIIKYSYVDSILIRVYTHTVGTSVYQL